MGNKIFVLDGNIFHNKINTVDLFVIEKIQLVDLLNGLSLRLFRSYFQLPPAFQHLNKNLFKVQLTLGVSKFRLCCLSHLEFVFEGSCFSLVFVHPDLLMAVLALRWFSLHFAY